MAKRKSLDSNWCCSWGCGFEDLSIQKVLVHEEKAHSPQAKDA